MFSKILSRATQQSTQLSSLQYRAFRASTVANNKKPSIGDAVTILQSKVSGINQVVSIHDYLSVKSWPRSFEWWFKNVPSKILIFVLDFFRTTSKNSAPSSPSVMVSPESSVSPRFRPVRWWNSSRESKVWLSTWKLTTLVLSSWVTIGKFIRLVS